MNNITRFLFISCLANCILFVSAATVLEKQLELGKDPKTKKTLFAKGYAFVEGTTAATDTRWVCVYPSEKEIFFLSLKNGEQETFPISDLIITQQTFDIILDPTTGEQATEQAIKSGTPMITIHMTLDSRIQIFRDLIILMAKNDTKALSALINKHSLTTINEIIERAVDCQGECLPFFDDIETMEKVLQKGITLNKPLSFTGKVIFLPIAELTQELLHIAQEQEQQTA